MADSQEQQEKCEVSCKIWTTSQLHGFRQFRSLGDYSFCIVLISTDDQNICTLQINPFHSSGVLLSNHMTLLHLLQGQTFVGSLLSVRCHFFYSFISLSWVFTQVKTSSIQGDVSSIKIPSFTASANASGQCETWFMIITPFKFLILWHKCCIQALRKV